MSKKLKFCVNRASNCMVRNMSSSLWDAAWANVHSDVDDMIFRRCTRENGVHMSKFFLIRNLKDSIDVDNHE